MRKYVPILFIAFLTIVFGGCYYDKAETLFPPEAKCDTANMKYNTDIKPILTTNCERCHRTNGIAGNRWRLENFSEVQAAALNPNRMFDRITRHPTNDSKLMPQGGPKLDTCTIIKIKAWINRGALNN